MNSLGLAPRVHGGLPASPSHIVAAAPEAVRRQQLQQSVAQRLPLVHRTVADRQVQGDVLRGRGEGRMGARVVTAYDDMML